MTLKALCTSYLFVIPAPGVLSSICVVDIDVFALKNWKIKDNTGMINNGVNLNPGAELNPYLRISLV